MHDKALHDQDYPVLGQPAERGLSAAVLFIGKSLPNPHADRAQILAAALAIADSDPESPNGKRLKRFLKENPAHYGANRSSAWVNALRRCGAGPRARLTAYLAQFPNTVTLGQRQAMARFLQKRMAEELRSLLNGQTPRTLGGVANELLLERFGRNNRPNAPRHESRKEAWGIHNFA